MGCCCSKPKEVVEPIPKPTPKPPPSPVVEEVQEIKVEDPLPEPEVKKEAPHVVHIEEPEPMVVQVKKMEPVWGPTNDMERKYWHVLKKYKDYKFLRLVGDGSYGEVIEVQHRDTGDKMKIYA